MTRLFTLSIAALLSVGVYLSCSRSAAHESAQVDSDTLGVEVSVQTVAAMKGKAGVVVLDVRELFEYKDAHIPGVVHVPMGQVMNRTSAFLRNKVVFVTCRSGNRSGQIVAVLRAQGHANVHNMSGGLIAWKAAGLPIEADSGR